MTNVIEQKSITILAFTLCNICVMNKHMSIFPISFFFWQLNFPNFLRSITKRVKILLDLLVLNPKVLLDPTTSYFKQIYSQNERLQSEVPINVTGKPFKLTE